MNFLACISTHGDVWTCSHCHEPIPADWLTHCCPVLVAEAITGIAVVHAAAPPPDHQEMS